jgi:hypothetical protein
MEKIAGQQKLGKIYSRCFDEKKHENYSIWKDKQTTENKVARSLKGIRHEIFDIRFFFINQCPPGP